MIKPKTAKIFGHPQRAEVSTAEKLLRENGYKIYVIPTEGMFEIEVFPTENRADVRRIDGLETLEAFLNGQPIPGLMWTIV